MSGGHTPRAFVEQACTITLSSRTVHVGCCTRDEADEVFEWLCKLPCEDIADPSVVPELVAALQFLADSARATTGFSSPMALADADKLLAKIGGDA